MPTITVPDGPTELLKARMNELESTWEEYDAEGLEGLYEPTHMSTLKSAQGIFRKMRRGDAETSKIEIDPQEITVLTNLEKLTEEIPDLEGSKELVQKMIEAASKPGVDELLNALESQHMTKEYTLINVLSDPQMSKAYQWAFEDIDLLDQVDTVCDEKPQLKSHLDFVRSKRMEAIEEILENQNRLRGFTENDNPVTRALSLRLYEAQLSHHQTNDEDSMQAVGAHREALRWWLSTGGSEIGIKNVPVQAYQPGIHDVPSMELTIAALNDLSWVAERNITEQPELLSKTQERIQETSDTLANTIEAVQLVSEAGLQEQVKRLDRPLIVKNITVEELKSFAETDDQKEFIDDHGLDLINETFLSSYKKNPRSYGKYNDHIQSISERLNTESFDEKLSEQHFIAQTIFDPLEKARSTIFGEASDDVGGGQGSKRGSKDDDDDDEESGGSPTKRRKHPPW